MEHAYQSKFPNIVDIVLVACRSGENIKKLREIIIELAAQRALAIPKSYGFLEENVNMVRAEFSSMALDHPIPPIITWKYDLPFLSFVTCLCIVLELMHFSSYLFGLQRV